MTLERLRNSADEIFQKSIVSVQKLAQSEYWVSVKSYIYAGFSQFMPHLWQRQS